MRLRTGFIGTLFVIGATVPLAGQAAAAVPTCGSSDQVHNAPYDCAKRRTIDGTSFRVHLHVPVTGGVRVTFNLNEPRQGVTDVHVQLHAGIDGRFSVDRGDPARTRRDDRQLPPREPLRGGRGVRARRAAQQQQR